MKESHGIFVTGLEFTSSSSTCRAITGDFDCSLLSVSADNQIKIHQVAPRSKSTIAQPIHGFRDWSLITGRGRYKRGVGGGGHVKFYPTKKGGGV